MTKWVPVNPADLAPGEKFRAVSESTTVTGIVKDVAADVVQDAIDNEWVYVEWDWFRRKPKPPKRPAEPPAATLVRKVSTGEQGLRQSSGEWLVVSTHGTSDWLAWDAWIAPGDEIELLWTK